MQHPSGNFATRVKVWVGSLRMMGLWTERRIARAMGVEGLHFRHLQQLIAETGLFDETHYTHANPDVTESGRSALAHYVQYGDREGRKPCALFEPRFYRANAPGTLKRINSLLHYWLVGRHSGLQPCPLFSSTYYLANNPDVEAEGVDPLGHFLKHGGLEGRSPSAEFDSRYYLEHYPHVAAARVNPLAHYLQYGFAEGLLPKENGGIDGSDEHFQVTLEPNEFRGNWDTVMPRSLDLVSRRLDVIIPVYMGRHETFRCIHSVLTAKTDVAFDLVVINDASPDGELVMELEQQAKRGLFTLLHNTANVGFVRTVNRGMALHADRDVLLLNADTEVYGGWLDRLMAAADGHPRAGTVTPLSNSATICSYPRFNHDNPFPLEVSNARIAQLAAEVNSGEVVEAPTGVGFCMLLRRTCMDQVGSFDEAAFGKGYGEENDFCQRAMRHGWANLIATDVFVRHVGGASFRGEKEARVRAAIATLNARYPKYDEDVMQFVRNDPLAGARQRLDWARLMLLCQARNVLMVSHNRGGGTERHIREDGARLMSEGWGVYYLRPLKGMPSRVVISHPQIRLLPNLSAFELGNDAALSEALRKLRITEIHTHGLVDFPPDAPATVARLAEHLGARLEVNLHDYKVICPRLNLVDDDGVYCGEPDEAGCNSCLRRLGSDFMVTDIAQWRSVHQRALGLADHVYAPNEDVALRINRYFPNLKIEVVPHESTDQRTLRLTYPTLRSNEKLRIVVIGAIGKIKGFEVIRRCADIARRERLPLEFLVMGYTSDDHAMRAAGVYVSGKYLDSNAAATLANLKPHVVWLPSTWPETYSYTLSLAFGEGYPVVAFDLGALARRIRASGQEGMLVPLEWVHDTEKMNAHFLKIRSTGVTGAIQESMEMIRNAG